MQHFFCFAIFTSENIKIASSLALFFLIVFLVFTFLYYLKKIVKIGVKRVLEKIRLPLFLLISEVYFLLTLDLYNIPASFHPYIVGVISILILATIAYLFERTAFAIYRHVSERATAEGNGMIRTQSLFLYRAAVFVIIFLTFAFLFLIFPAIKSVGLGLIGGAGIVGIAAGIAARPIFSNVISGFIIAFNKTIRIGDGLFIYDTYGKVEQIRLTHVVIQTWDLIRIVVPMTEFVEKPFQNTDLIESDMIGTIFLYCDYNLSVEHIREKCREIIEAHPLYTKRGWNVSVTEMKEMSMQIRIILSARNNTELFTLRCDVREKLIAYLQQFYPDSLPVSRYITTSLK